MSPDRPDRKGLKARKGLKPRATLTGRGSAKAQASVAVTAKKKRNERFVPKPTRVVPRFAGVPTFLRLPEHDDPADVDVMICGVPFDGGTTFRPGARFGPRAVRVASALTRGFNVNHGFSLFDRITACDGGDVACIPMSIERSLELIADRSHSIASAGTIPAFVGGDHTITLGVLRGLAKVHGPLGLIHFDAHSDSFGPAWGIDIHHGTIFRNAVTEGLLRPNDVVQIGIRGPFTSSDDLSFANAHGFRLMMIDEVKRSLSALEDELKTYATRGKLYVSFDVDALDPAYAPGTGTPVPGGMNTYEALSLIRAIAGHAIVGCDVVEISPDHDTSGNTALVAATLLTEILASIAAGR